MKIHPQEFHIRENGGIIRTRCPRDLITDDMIVREARRNNLSMGDSIPVQCVDHPYETVLHEVEYRVRSCKEVWKTKENLRGDIHQEAVREYSVVRLGEWLTLEQDSGSLAHLPDLEGETVEVADDTTTEAKRGPGRPRKAEAA